MERLIAGLEQINDDESESLVKAAHHLKETEENGRNRKNVIGAYASWSIFFVSLGDPG